MSLPHPTCFIAMPISTSAHDASTYEDPDHWEHVLEALFVPAVVAAGFMPVRPSARGAVVIQAEIVRHLQDSDLVLCDLSSHNPNVFFELGVRTALNLPIALVRDDKSSLPFDTSIVNTLTYSSALRSWEAGNQQERLSEHLLSSAGSSGGANPLWQAFGLTLRATEPVVDEGPHEAKLDVLMREVAALRKEQRSLQATEPIPRITDEMLDEF